MTPDQALSTALQGLYPDVHIYIALSGGLDSSVLLQSLAERLKEHPRPLTALHVNHGLSIYADQWQHECHQACEQLGIDLRVHKVDLGGPDSVNLEKRARDARYRWFSSLLKRGDILLTGHHLDDQAETLLLRLMRASGTRGLAAIPVSRSLGEGRVVRPFLALPKSSLKDYAQTHGLNWVEDESNVSLEFDRNYVRHQVIPALAARWPSAISQLASSAAHCREDQLLLDELAALDLAAVETVAGDSFLSLHNPLDLARFTALSCRRQRHLLQSILRRISGLSIASTQMSEWLRQVANYRRGGRGRHGLTLGMCSLAIYDGQMHFLKNVPDLSERKISWDISQPLNILELDVCLSVQEAGGDALRQTGARVLQIEQSEALQVHWRRGGERVQRFSDTHSSALKKLMQQQKVAPWLRSALPLISFHGRIVWSAALGEFAPGLQDHRGNRLKINIVKIK